MTFADTYTFSIVDVRKVVDMFAADLDMIQQRTGYNSQAWVDDVTEDIAVFACNDYLDKVEIVLLDAGGKPVRANRYRPSTNASGWTSDRPGGNNWTAVPGGSLSVLLTYSSTFNQLAETTRSVFKASLNRPWSPSDIDNSFTHLQSASGRRYASNAYGFERSSFA
jgi:hypothetical protein